jgi:hypothetical protein
MLTAKNVIYLVNLSERDYIRKKNKWLPKIKAWVDENNPGDLILPFSVALEERISRMTPEEEAAELEKLGTTSALNKIMTAGYQGLNVSRVGLLVKQDLLTISLAAHPLLHGWSGRIESLDDPQRDTRTAGCRCHSHRFREEFHLW